MLIEKYLTEKNGSFGDVVKNIFITKLKSSDPKKAKEDTLKAVKREAEKFINIALHKELKM
jgi:hypothetical protein